VIQHPSLLTHTGNFVEPEFVPVQDLKCQVELVTNPFLRYGGRFRLYAGLCDAKKASLSELRRLPGAPGW